MNSESKFEHGWYPDPVGVYQYRWWDGTWTDRVAQDGEVYDSPLAAGSGDTPTATVWTARGPMSMPPPASPSSVDQKAGGYAAYRETPKAHLQGGMALLIIGVLVGLFNLFAGGFIVLLAIASFIYAISLKEPQSQPIQTAGRSVEQRLQDLERLRASGHIGDQEYTAQRARILADI